MKSTTSKSVSEKKKKNIIVAVDSTSSLSSAEMDDLMDACNIFAQKLKNDKALAEEVFIKLGLVKKRRTISKSILSSTKSYPVMCTES